MEGGGSATNPEERDEDRARPGVGQRRILTDATVSSRLAWVSPDDVARWSARRDTSSWLSAAEQEMLDDDSPERAADRLASRLALKLLVREEGEFASRALTEIETMPDEHGRPRLVLEGERRSPRVSLSHARGWGAAGLCWQGLVGVDIEHERPGLDRVRRRLLGPGERAQDARTLLATWVVKEAAVKAFGAGIDVPLTEVGIRLEADGRAAVRMPSPVSRWDPAGVPEGVGRWVDFDGTAVAIVQFSTGEQFF